LIALPATVAAKTAVASWTPRREAALTQAYVFQIAPANQIT